MSWNDLSISQKADLMNIYINNGITNLADIRNHYNQFAEGGEIDDDNPKSNELTDKERHQLRRSARFMEGIRRKGLGYKNKQKDRDEEYYARKTDADFDAGAAQDTYLLNRDTQRKVFHNRGYIDGEDGDYGLVRKAVDNRQLPIYQTRPNAIDRSELTPIGDMEYSYNGGIGLKDPQADLTHAGSFPTQYYIGTDGKLYAKGWDLNDYAGTSVNYGRQRLGKKLRDVGAKVLDEIGSPVVVTTGYQPVDVRDRMLYAIEYDPNHRITEESVAYMPKFLQDKMINGTLSYNIDEDKFINMLTPIVVTPQGNYVGQRELMTTQDFIEEDDNKYSKGGPIHINPANKEDRFYDYGGNVETEEIIPPIIRKGLDRLANPKTTMGNIINTAAGIVLPIDVGAAAQSVLDLDDMINNGVTGKKLGHFAWNVINTAPIGKITKLTDKIGNRRLDTIQEFVGDTLGKIHPNLTKSYNKAIETVQDVTSKAGQHTYNKIVKKNPKVADNFADTYNRLADIHNFGVNTLYDIHDFIEDQMDINASNISVEETPEETPDVITILDAQIDDQQRMIDAINYVIDNQYSEESINKAEQVMQEVQSNVAGRGLTNTTNATTNTYPTMIYAYDTNGKQVLVDPSKIKRGKPDYTTSMLDVENQYEDGYWYRNGRDWVYLNRNGHTPRKRR